MPFKLWTRIQDSYDVTCLASPFGKWALWQANEILCKEKKSTRQLQPFYCWFSSQSSSFGGEAPAFLLMALAPSVSVKWHSDCSWWNFTPFILHSLQYVQEWLQLSGTCNLLDLEGVCPEAASLPSLTWNSWLPASKSFCHITNSQTRMDWVSSSLLWADWQSENPHFLSWISSFILFTSLLNNAAQGNILDITATFMLT